MLPSWAFDASAPLPSPGGIKQYMLLLSAIDTVGFCRVVQGACFEGLKDLGHLHLRRGGQREAEMLPKVSRMVALLRVLN